MKKNFKYALLGAIALTGAVSFSACSSSEDVVDNPDYNPETNSVKTAITMNIGRSAQTRMSSDITQNAGNFRGMYNVYIYPATVGTAESWSAIIGSSTISAPVVSNQTISGIAATASSKTFSEVQLTIGTNNFLFYGRAGSSDPTTTEAKLSNGYTVPTFPSSGAASGVSFASQQIVGSSLPAGWTGPAGLLINYLNSIKDAFGSTTITNPAFESLRLDFLKPATPRAGSADAVLATVNHMYTELNKLNLEGGEATTRGNIINAIIAAPGSLSDGTIRWATSGENILSETTFPANIGLPLGAAQYQYNASSNLFEYISATTANVANTAVADYIYPSELFYFTNTPLKATSGNVDWPSTTATWQAAFTTDDWKPAVQASSKNIALVNNVQYGTALLATCVKCTPLEGKLYDNSNEKDPTKEENIAINYADNMFPLTGVLVGAQASSVGWNFLPLAGTSFTRCVYDKNMTSTIYANNTGDSYSSPNYTMVYDNDGYSVEEDATVNVCLEFENKSGVDFFGKDGLIKNNQKFYLIGKLNPSGSTAPAMNTAAVYYPSTALRVFIQDYTTTAKFEITAGSATEKGSLANALSCIPDLKAVTQEIGLSVDLNWTPGLTYTVPLGQ